MGFPRDFVYSEIIIFFIYLCEYRGLERVYAVVLRANHFEQFDKISKEYQTISLEDCYNAAKNSPTYQNQNNETSPFYTDDFIKRIAQKIQECSFFDNSSDLDWKKWASKNPRFLDAACFYTLQKIAELFLDSETANIEKAVDMIATYISNKNQQ